MQVTVAALNLTPHGGGQHDCATRQVEDQQVIPCRRTDSLSMLTVEYEFVRIPGPFGDHLVESCVVAECCLHVLRFLHASTES
jgi:hypothetical protein